MARPKVKVKVEKVENPIPRLWTYNPDDKTTWKYIECRILTDKHENVVGVNWIKNPNFKYADKDIAHERAYK